MFFFKKKKKNPLPTSFVLLMLWDLNIAEEARKHGIVERCFVRIIQREDVDDPSEKVRVFILYSGLVGAWKAVKTFDGRFFGGRNIRARFAFHSHPYLDDFFFLLFFFLSD
jgi:hypothetical protein